MILGTNSCENFLTQFSKIRLFGLSRPCKAELDDNAGASMATSGGQDMKAMENLKNPSPN